MRVPCLTLTLTLALIGAAGCGDDTETSIESSVANSVVTRERVFDDTFIDDRHGWGTVPPGEFGSVSFSNGDHVMDFRGRVSHWTSEGLITLAERTDIGLGRIAVGANLTLASGTGVVGVGCRSTTGDDAMFEFYEFVVRDGFGAIRRSDDESNIEVLAETSDVSVTFGEPFDIEGRCEDRSDGSVALSMYQDGEFVLDAIDDSRDPLTSGWPAMQAWTFPVHDRIDILWHDFYVDVLSDVP